MSFQDLFQGLNPSLELDTLLRVHSERPHSIVIMRNAPDYTDFAEAKLQSFALPALSTFGNEFKTKLFILMYTFIMILHFADTMEYCLVNWRTEFAFLMYTDYNKDFMNVDSPFRLPVRLNVQNDARKEVVDVEKLYDMIYHQFQYVLEQDRSSPVFEWKDGHEDVKQHGLQLYARQF